MSEDEPLEPIAPEPATEPMEPVTAEAATAEAVATGEPTEPVAAGEPSGPPPWGAAGAPPPPSSGGSTVAVPKWLLILVGVIVVAVSSFAVGFGAGWVAAPSDDDERSVRMPDRELTPPDGSRGGGDLPDTPREGAQDAFLGVATSRSTDPAGARVEEVVPDSPASEAGLETDDVITKVDDDTIANPTQLAERIGAHRAGDEVTITYVRDGSTETEDVTLVRRMTIEPSTPSTTEPEF